MKTIFGALIITALLAPHPARAQAGPEPVSINRQMLDQDDTRLRTGQAQLGLDESRLDSDQRMDNQSNLTGDVQKVQQDQQQLNDTSATYARDRANFAAQTKTPQ